MKRIKKIILFLFFVMLFFPISTVFAADCSTVQNAVNELEELENTYAEMDCKNATDSLTLSECSTIQVRKTIVLEKIFKYNEEKDCPSIDLSSIIDKYSDICSNEFSSEIKEISDAVMNIFFITAPFLLLIFGSLDFFKIVVGSNPEQIKKNRSNFIKRVVAFFLLYLTPVIVRAVFSLTPYDMNGNTYICAEEIDLNPKVTSVGVKGKFGGYKGGGVIGAGDRQAIADAAYEIRESAINNGYYYSCNGESTDFTLMGTSSLSHMCCAEIIAPSLYNAGIYDYDQAKLIHTTSAPDVTDNLIEAGWETVPIDELEPGDVIVYKKTIGWEDVTGGVKIDGEYIPVPHVEIYYGDGLKISTGSFKSSDVATSLLYNGYSVDDGYQIPYCGLRYVGK